MKNRLMAGTIIIALLAAVGWCYLRLSDASATASAATQDLSECRALATQIESLRQRPTVAGTGELAATDLSNRIEQAAHTAGITAECIERIEPQPTHRVEDSNYLESPTEVHLRQVTIQQVFTFLHTLCDDPHSVLHVRDIRLSAPRGEETGDHWTVEATLTYTVYSPKGAGAS